MFQHIDKNISFAILTESHLNTIISEHILPLPQKFTLTVFPLEINRSLRSQHKKYHTMTNDIY